MASSIMKRAVAAHQAQQKAAATPALVPPAARTAAPRAALLTGINIERWLGEQVAAHRKDKSTSATTKARYAQVALTLDITRPYPWEPVNIEQAAKTKNTFYAYRAAVRWSALGGSSGAEGAFRSAIAGARR